MARLLVGTDGTENYAVSRDGSEIFVAGHDGFVREYSVGNGALLHKWLVGQSLGGIALSPDGTQIVATESVPVSTHQTSDWTSNVTVDAVYQLDVASGYVQTYDYTTTGDGYTFTDVAFAGNNTVVLAQNILPGWSGWAPIFTLNLDTVQFTAHGSFYSGLGSTPSLTSSASDNTVLVGQLGLSSADYFLLSDTGTVTASVGDYANGIMGYAQGIEAIGGSGASGRIAFASGGGLYLFNLHFGYITNLAEADPALGSATGLAFSADASILYVVNPTAGEIDAIALEDNMIIQRISLGGYTPKVMAESAELTVLPDGHTFLVSTTLGLVEVTSSGANIPTDHADKLIGTAGDDTIVGLLGGDHLFGQGGADKLYGDGGNDHVWGCGGNDILFGGAGKDALFGGEGNDILVGGAGKDTLTGGGGADAFVFSLSDSGAKRSNADVITDFSHTQHDLIDLSSIDSNVVRPGRQPFHFIGDAAFAGKGQQLGAELHYVHADGMTYVEGDLNGDGKADFTIALTGTIDLVASDFLL